MTEQTSTAPPGSRLRRILGAVVADRRPLRIPAFRRLWLSSIVTALGSQLTAVAVPKQIYDITGSSAYVGLTGLFGLVPLLVFGLWGGAIADTVDRRVLLLVTNVGVAWLLYAYREGDSNMRSVWLCTRNDALGNLAVLLAALGVFGTGSAWPDLTVAIIMASLAVTAAVQILLHAQEELDGDALGHKH